MKLYFLIVFVYSCVTLMSANHKLGEKLISLNRQQFTGVLTISSQDDQLKWEMFFYSGNYLWTEGGYHANRAWQRHFKYYFSHIDPNSITLRARNQGDIRSLQYSLLNVLLQRQLIERKQVKALLVARSQEVFFDLLQKEYHVGLNYQQQNTSAHYLLKAGFNLSLDSINIENFLFQVQSSWSSWGAKGLASCSPNYAPFLYRHQELQQLIPDVIVNNMSRLLNGKRTLRDLALKMEKDILELTCGIVPYFFKGYLRLLEIPDLPSHN